MNTTTTTAKILALVAAELLLEAAWSIPGVVFMVLVFGIYR